MADHDPNDCLVHNCAYYEQAMATMDAALLEAAEARAANEALIADAAYYKRKATDMQAAYEAKIQDFARETLINSQLRAELRASTEANRE